FRAAATRQRSLPKSNGSHFDLLLDLGCVAASPLIPFAVAGSLLELTGTTSFEIRTGSRRCRKTAE
ncbi:MAG: hypothetical protein ACYCPM_02435, partial [Acidobacteriaceae bacterium]